MRNLAKHGSGVSVWAQSHLGLYFAVFGGAVLGSSLSVRSFSQFGSGLAVFGRSRLHGAVSVLDYSVLGSTLSLRSFGYSGSTISIVGRTIGNWLSAFDNAEMGSSVSIRQCMKFGSTCSLVGKATVQGRFSCMSYVGIGSSLALRSYARLGSGVSATHRSLVKEMSVFDFLLLGSTLAIRSFARLGSHLSIAGSIKTASNTYVRRLESASIDSEHVMSQGDARVKGNLEVEGSARFHGSADFSGKVNAGTLEAESATVGGDLTVGGSVHIPGGSLAPGPRGGVEVVADGWRSIRATSSGGSLHGVWLADGAISTSDRRLKSEVTELVRTLSRGERKAPDEKRSAGWVLRELRPVSFTFKEERSQGLRFGFIADEIACILPELVRDLGNLRQGDGPEKFKGVVYQDLIALLAAAQQQLQLELELLQRSFEQYKDDSERRIQALEARVAHHSRFEAIASAALARVDQ
mmetsp:Transcript_9998/g.21362  ORF Transcript_9998/g.21362 Transcript_9998/m.21362 type:complete len:466 (-) Transcript_9998:145-1542(-)